MSILSRRVLVAASIACLTACTSSQTAQFPTVVPPDVATSSKLQFAVGVATIGASGGRSVKGLNVVATFRSADGNNATNTNTPTITGPAGLDFGPDLGNSNVVTGVDTKQYVELENALVSGSSTLTPALRSQLLGIVHGLGPYVGVFGYGLAADNRFAIQDARIQGSALDPASLSPCLGVAFPGYLNTGNDSQFPPGVGIAGNAASLTPGLGIYYGSGGAAAGVSKNRNDPQPSFSVVAELERSAELALPIPSGPNNGACTCPQTCASQASSPLSDMKLPNQYFGGPPAWPSPQGYGNYAYFVGYPIGFTDFAATPVAGDYSMSVSYPTSADYRSTGSLTARAHLANATGLPPIVTPTLTVGTDGSATLSNLNVPAGVSETVVFVTTNDCDLTGRVFQAGGPYFNHYAFVVHGAGAQQPIFIAPNLGPPGLTTPTVPTHTFCTTGDLAAEEKALAASGQTGAVSTNFIYQVEVVGFDYPAYEQSYPFVMSQTPKILGPSGQSDVTTGYPTFAAFNVPPPTTGS